MAQDKFVFLPLLYELVTGAASTEEVSPSYESLLKSSRVNFVQGKVDTVDFNTRSISLIDGQGERIPDISYDQLVIAAGAQARLEVPGASENAIPFYTAKDAYTLQLKLRAAIADAVKDGREVVRVAVVGGGYSGVETATSIAEYLGNSKSVVSLVDRNSKVMISSPDFNRKSAEKALLSYGISVNSNTDVKEVLTNGLVLENTIDKEIFEMPADLVIYTAGMKSSDLVESLQLEKVFLVLSLF